LQDAQRALRIIRANAATVRDRPCAIAGVLGFSAGGHVAASLATRSGVKVYPPVDDADMQSAAPAFAAVLYPVITMLPPYAHEASREQLLGDHPSTEMRAAYSCERLVTRETPPCFLAAAVDDPDVPVDNSLAMLTGLRAAHVRGGTAPVRDGRTRFRPCHRRTRRRMAGSFHSLGTGARRVSRDSFVIGS
jgi:acetyl esterase/lipase